MEADLEKRRDAIDKALTLNRAEIKG